MAITMDEATARAVRMASHGLGRAPMAGVLAAARETGGLQAQNPGAARLGIRARTRGLDLTAINQAHDMDREVVVSWLMRGTLHLVPAEDFRWLIAFYGPLTNAKYRTRRKEFGLTDEVCAKALSILEAVLADSGQLTKAELVARLADGGVPIEPTGQAPVHLIVYAASLGLICRGPEATPGDPTYVLLDEWIPKAMTLPANETVLELARRYFSGFGPATAVDFATWAGIALGPARQAIAELGDYLLPADVAGTPMYLRNGSQDSAQRAVRLIPAFDNYMFGYRDRSILLDPAHNGQIFQGGVARAAVVVDGRIVGTWTQKRTTKLSTVTVDLFEQPKRRIGDELEAEAADLACFFTLASASAVTVNYPA